MLHAIDPTAKVRLMPARNHHKVRPCNGKSSVASWRTPALVNVAAGGKTRAQRRLETIRPDWINSTVDKYGRYGAEREQGASNIP